MKIPKRRLLLASVCTIPFLVGTMQGTDVTEPGPVYNGRSLAAWVDVLPSHISRVADTNRSDVQAIRAIGTNAIPWLLRELTLIPWTPGSNSIHGNRARW